MKGVCPKLRVWTEVWRDVGKPVAYARGSVTEAGFEFGADFVEVELGGDFGVLVVLDFGFGDGQAGNEIFQRKIEPKIGKFEAFPAVFDGVEVVGHGFDGLGGGVGFAILLDLFEFGEDEVAVFAEAGLLDGQIVEIATVGEEEFGFEEGFADGGVGFVGEEGGEFAAAEGQDAGFERGDAE